ncbi:MAG: uracil phosphoribosyltransferase [Bacteroidia bacterium]|nr:uracil phosphoribosyltransferase [Bacteroidia bacterium]
MIIHDLSSQKSLLNTFISEIRDITIQKDSMRFRRNIERIGEVLGYELSKQLSYEERLIQTQSQECTMDLPENKIVICSVLRAGVPLHNGLLNYFDRAENAFISAYRHHKKDDPDEFEIVVEYLASPSLDNKTLILADPMLATGQSLVSTFEALKPFGTPKDIHLVSVIASKKGIENIKNYFPEDTHLWVAVIDEKLDKKGYIVPGLGDAGDLAFGSKLQK